MATGNPAYALSVNTMTTTASVASLSLRMLFVNHQLSWKTAAAPPANSVVQAWFSPKIASGAFTWVNCIGQTTTGTTTATADNSLSAGDIASTLATSVASASYSADKLTNSMTGYECDTASVGANGDWTSLNVISSIQLDTTITGINGKLQVG